MSNARAHIFFFFILAAAAIIVSRLFSLQALEGGFWAAMARGQQQVYSEVSPERGSIYFLQYGGEAVLAAHNRPFPFVYAVPRDIKDPQFSAEKLGGILGIAPEELLSILSKGDDPYEPLYHRLTEEQAAAIETANLPGVRIKQERLRNYPYGDIASHALGFVGYGSGTERVGTYGIEGAYEDILRGEEGLFQGEKDVAGTLISILGKEEQSPKKGADIVLTIDLGVQFAVERALKAALEKWHAEGGSVVVMEPKTGAITAMASVPNFDPNHYEEQKDAEVFANPVIGRLFEPGSVFKPLTMASAIDKGVITPHTTYENTNEVKIGGYTIRNVLEEQVGVRSMVEVLEYSLNTGAVFAEQQLGGEDFREYLEQFGLGARGGLGLPGAEKGNLANLYENREINFATASFGQGVAVTPLALIRAVSAIANGGKLMEPFIISAIRYSDGTVEQTKPKEVRQVIAPKTATQVSAMMVSVVENGTGNKARIPGYTVAGKTGTAEIPRKDGRGYESGSNIHSFVGFAPAFDPKFAILVKLDSPKGVRHGATSAAPVFKEIAEYLFNYYGIPPDNPS